jgi:hypothetical protein
VTCVGFHVSAESPAQFADEVQWFGEEIIAKVKGAAAPVAA